MLVLTAILLPVFLWMRSAAGRQRLDPLMETVARRHLVWLLVVPLAMAQSLLRLQVSDDHIFVGDAHGWLEFAILVLLGGLIAGWREVLAAVQRERWPMLAVGAMAYLTIKLLWPQLGENPGTLPPGQATAWAVLSALNLMGWVLATLGFLTRWFNRGSPALAYLTEAALPVYVLHQTLIVWSVFHLRHVAWPLFPKIALTLGFALTVSLAAYELLIRRNATLRLLFGVKARARTLGLESFLGPLTSRWRARSS